VRVEFRKQDHKGTLLASWQATRAKRTVVPDSVMAAGKGLPHDVAQYVIEAATGYQGGFWDLVSRGATFKSTGRKRTRPGRALIAANRPELAGAEKLAGTHTAQWRAGRPSAVTDALQRALEQWRDLTDDQRLVFDWPSARCTVVDVALETPLPARAG
jgi:hypothetical protein